MERSDIFPFPSLALILQKAVSLLNSHVDSPKIVFLHGCRTGALSCSGYQQACLYPVFPIELEINSILYDPPKQAWNLKLIWLLFVACLVYSDDQRLLQLSSGYISYLVYYCRASRGKEGV